MKIVADSVLLVSNKKLFVYLIVVAVCTVLALVANYVFHLPEFIACILFIGVNILFLFFMEWNKIDKDMCGTKKYSEKSKFGFSLSQFDQIRLT